MNQPEIIEKLKKGDTAVFSDVVTQWSAMVYNVAINIVQSQEDAEDITQEVFVQLHESSAQLRGEAMLSTWLYRVTINKALDHERKKKRKKRGGLIRSVFISGESEGPAHFEHPGVLAENKEYALILFKALAKLPEAQRIAFMLQKIEGRSHAEIADITGNTQMGVESLIARSKVNLRRILRDWYEKNIK